MATAEHFIEAHFYASGLRHQAYGVGRSRPPWAPAEDSVGFQNEFPLENGDGAVELRRFEIGKDSITWLAIYYRSIDTKLGDRQNHAGVGLWLRNGVITDVAALLYGLGKLADFLAKNVDTKALGSHVEKFLEPTFLPNYLRSIDDFPFARGAPYGPAAMVDTQQYFVSCERGVGECRALSDYLLNLMLYGSDPSLKPRSLILVSSNDRPSVQGMTIIPKDFDAASFVAVNLPEIFADAIKRAQNAERKADELNKQLSELSSETVLLRADNEELENLRKDPINAVLRRLDELSAQIDNLAGSQRPLPATYPPVTTLVTRSRSPISSSSRPTAEPQYEIDWFKIVALVVLVFSIPILLYLAYDLVAR